MECVTAVAKGLGPAYRNALVQIEQLERFQSELGESDGNSMLNIENRASASVATLITGLKILQDGYVATACFRDASSDASDDAEKFNHYGLQSNDAATLLAPEDHWMPQDGIESLLSLNTGGLSTLDTIARYVTALEKTREQVIRGGSTVYETLIGYNFDRPHTPPPDHETLDDVAIEALDINAEEERERQGNLIGLDAWLATQTQNRPLPSPPNLVVEGGLTGREQISLSDESEDESQSEGGVRLSMEGDPEPYQRD